MGDHHGQHDDCFACKLKTIQFGNVVAPPERLMEKRWDRDLAAYKRLRQQGLQPKTTRHAAQLEAQASTQREIEMGFLADYSSNEIRQVMPAIEEGMQAAKEVGWDLGYARQKVKENGGSSAGGN